jgi:hypothetical protein
MLWEVLCSFDATVPVQETPWKGYYLSSEIIVMLEKMKYRVSYRRLKVMYVIQGWIMEILVGVLNDNGMRLKMFRLLFAL